MKQAIATEVCPLESIVIPDSAPGPVVFAAAELRKYLRLALAVDIPIMHGGPSAGSIFITTTELNPGEAAISDGFRPGLHDRSVAVVADGCLGLVGENARSALYAVYDFLQAKLNIRFFAPGEEHEVIPRGIALELPERGTVMSTGSTFEFRDFWVWNDRSAIDFAVKNRINVIGCLHDKGRELDLSIVEETHRRGALLRGPGHVWAQFLPEPKAFDACPELLPLIGGTRTYNGKTLCFSNPQARKLFFDGMRNYLRAYPCWDIFAFWAEDIHLPHYCECERCLQQGTSTWYLGLVNEAAALVEAELPHALLEFIAYHESREPPAELIPLHRNGERMFFDFCGGYSRELYHPLASKTGGSKDVYRMYRSWLEYLERIGYRGKRFLMEYYNLCEGPNQDPRGRALLWPLDVIREDTLAYRRDGIDGLGSWFCLDRFCFPVPFYTWCWLRLYTDPEKKIAEYADDFYPPYFGVCATAVRDYLDRLTAVMHASTTDENVSELRVLGQELEGLRAPAEDQVLARRLAVVHLHYDYCLLLKQLFLAILHRDSQETVKLCELLESFLERHQDKLAGEIDIPAMFWGGLVLGLAACPVLSTSRLSPTDR